MACGDKHNSTHMEAHPVACKMCIGCLTFWIIVGIVAFAWLRR